MSIKTSGDSEIRNGDLTLKTLKPQNNVNTVINFNAMTTVERLAYPFTGPSIIYDITLAQWFLNPSAGVFEQINGASTPSGPAGGVLTGTYPNPGLATDAVATANIQNNQVTYAKIQQIPATSLIGNSTGATANPSTVTPSGALIFSGSNLTTRSATIAVDGTVILAPDGGTTAGTVVQANDSRLTPGFNGNTASYVYQVYNSDTFNTTLSTVETTLKSFTFVGNSFQVNGDNMEGYFAGSFSLTAGNTLTIRVYIANILVGESILSFTASGAWRADFKAMRYSPLSLSVNTIISSDTLVGNGIIDMRQVNLTFTLSNPLIVELRGFVSNTANSLTCSMGVINCAKNV